MVADVDKSVTVSTSFSFGAEVNPSITKKLTSKDVEGALTLSFGYTNTKSTTYTTSNTESVPLGSCGYFAFIPSMLR